MSPLKKMLFENAYNSENIERILSTARDAAGEIENDYVESVEIDQQGNVYVNLTQEGRDNDEDVSEVRNQFFEYFHLLAVKELSDLR